MNVRRGELISLVGPSGCGKTTVLRCLNRMNDLTPNARLEGEVRLEGVNIYAPQTDVVDVRRRVGMVFQRPNPFPKSIYDNVAYGPRLYGVRRKSQLDEIVQQSLQRAALWAIVIAATERSGDRRNSP